MKICRGQVDVVLEHGLDFLYSAVLFESSYVLHLLLGIGVIEWKPFFISTFFACLTRKIVFVFPIETLNVVLKLHLFLIKDLNVRSWQNLMKPVSRTEYWYRFNLGERIHARSKFEDNRFVSKMNSIKEADLLRWSAAAVRRCVWLMKNATMMMLLMMMMIMGVLDGTSDASSIDSALEDPRITFAFCVTHETAFKNLKIHKFYF